MVDRKDDVKGKEPEAPVKYETPWKMLAVFAVLFLAMVAYGFVN
jgi:hypothetical protein